MFGGGPQKTPPPAPTTAAELGVSVSKTPAPMAFVSKAVAAVQTSGLGVQVLQCHNAASLPSLSQLLYPIASKTYRNSETPVHRQQMVVAQLS